MSPDQHPRCVIKLSGASLKSNTSAFSATFIKDLVLQLDQLVQSGVQPVLIPGGGNICRGKDLAPIFEVTQPINRVYLDYAGMLATVVNAVILKTAIHKHTQLKAEILSMIEAPSEVASAYNLDRANCILNQGKVLIIAGGIGQPDFSSDVGVFSKARELESKMILMGKHGTAGIYSEDPRVNPSSKMLEKTTFSEVIKKRLNVIDMAAAAIGLTNNFTVRIFDIEQPNAILSAWNGNGNYSDVTN